MQTRLMSAIEAVTNVAVGWLVALVATALLLPAFGYPVTTKDAIGISAAFTAISLARSYLIRRVFNALGEYKHGKDRAKGSSA